MNPKILGDLCEAVALLVRQDELRSIGFPSIFQGHFWEETRVNKERLTEIAESLERYSTGRAEEAAA